MGWEYNYCTNCSAVLAKPTPQEDLIYGKDCLPVARNISIRYL